MTARELIERKLEANLTDLQTLVLLALAEKQLLTFSHLADDLGKADSSVCMACNRLEVLGDVTRDKTDKPFQPVFFYLSDRGRLKVAWLLGKVSQAPRAVTV